MSGFVLKMIAMITMLIDHTASIHLEGSKWYLLLRLIGRIAFPIFCFLLVEGYFHTKDVYQYLRRLGIFALLSEIPFDMAFADNITRFDFLEKQNVFFTLFIGLSVIHLMNLVEIKFKNNIIASNLLDCAIVLIGSFIAVILSTDYNMYGILMIVSFYIFRANKSILTLVLLLVNFQLGGVVQAFGILSMIFIALYNGKKGTKFNRYIFYGFYPVHLLVLVLLSRVL